jgi:N-acylneuraminate cytidylyltransferase
MLKVGGKPLVQRAIDTAKEAGFDDICVTTDWADVVSLARQVGVLGLSRPLALCGDVDLSEVVHHVLGSYKKSGREFTSFTVLSPANPFTESRDVRSANEVLEKEGPQGVVSLTETRPHQFVHHRAGKREVWKEARPERGEPANRYEFSGGILCVGSAYFAETRRLVGLKSGAVFIPTERALSVNTPWDYLSACAWSDEIEKLKGEKID